MIYFNTKLHKEIISFNNVKNKQSDYKNNIPLDILHCHCRLSTITEVYLVRHNTSYTVVFYSFMIYYEYCIVLFLSIHFLASCNFTLKYRFCFPFLM